MGPTEVQRAPVGGNFPFKQPHAEFCMDTVDSPPDSPGSRGTANLDPGPSSSSSLAGASRRALLSEALRLATFTGWPHRFISAKSLAEAGFFFRGQGDQAQCAFCLIIISHWEPSDEPMNEHRQHAPNCPFVKGLPVGNVPMTEGDVLPNPRMASPASPLRNLTGIDTCSRYVHEIRPLARPEQESQPAHSLREEVTSTESSGFASLRGVQAHQRAKRPELATLEARLRTFKDWPLGLVQRPSQLAEAGFYYMGTGDHVRCFCCDGALRNWEPNDDPWTEHSRWFSRCSFLLSSKGSDYVREILDKYKEKEQDSCGTANPPAGEVKLTPAAENATSQQAESKKGGQELKEALLCKICYDQPMSIVFLPCGHSMSCPSCAAALSSCPLCRKSIEATVKAFFQFS